MDLWSSLHATSRASSPLGRAIQNGWNDFKDMSDDLTKLLGSLVDRWRRRRLKQNGTSTQQFRGDTELHESYRDHPHFRHLLLCVSQWKGYYLTKMVAIDLHLSSDAQIFRRMKVEYNRMIGSWRRFLSLKRLNAIRFVQVRST